MENEIQSKKEKYNIVLILLDGARFDRIKNLPNFNSWTSQGTLFSKLITYGAQTVMSMHATFTSLYGNVNGADNYFGSAFFKKNSCKTLASYLQDAGYKTLGDTINEIVVPPQGFDELLIHDENKDNLTERHKDLLEKADSYRKQNKNFFLYLHYSNIHTGMVKTVLKNVDDFDEKYFKNKQKNTENYDTYVKEADEYIGALLDKSISLDLSKDTLFILMADHGASVGDKIGEIGYGRYCYDYTMKSFAVFVQPKIFPIQEITKLARTVDITPTILDILKIPQDENYRKMQGKSILPLLKDEPDERIAYSESAGLVKPYPTKEKPLLKAIRTTDWKLIYNSQTNEKELYNLEEDPLEKNNLTTSNTQKVNQLFAELIKHSPEIK
jgi:arylsulfatase A-like enzyme